MSANQAPMLVLEDEFLIGLDLQEALRELGFADVQVVGDVQQALSLLAGETRFVSALLDVNVGNARSFAVAEVLRRNEVPFAFLTGYSEEEMPAEFVTAPVLRKPFSHDQLVQVLEDLGLRPAVL